MSGLPMRGRGRPTPASERRYQAELRAFAESILKIRSALEFAPSSRGWCYVLEGQKIISKGEFNDAQRVINDCRKSGILPLDICSEDSRRTASGLERIDDSESAEIQAWVDSIFAAPSAYTPISFWEDQEYYIELAVEKVDLKHLFAPVCREFCIPIQNIAGWADLWCRARMMMRFREHERAGREPVLLYCGDHDPGGLHISDWLLQNLWDMAGAAGWQPTNLIIDRFGLDYDFIERPDVKLTWIDNLETSSGQQLDNPKHKDHNKPYVQDYIAKYGVRKVEANALIVKPKQGRQLCRDAILKYLPETAPDDYKALLHPLRAAFKNNLPALIDEALSHPTL